MGVDFSLQHSLFGVGRIEWRSSVCYSWINVLICGLEILCDDAQSGIHDRDMCLFYD